MRRTQFFLKQSWEQKKLPLIPRLKHLGHWREPASFSQSAPRHFFFVGGCSVMVVVLVLDCSGTVCGYRKGLKEGLIG